MSEESVDVVGISETWLTEGITEQELSIDGYTLYRKDRQDITKTRGGGVALLIRNELNAVLVPELYNEYFNESLWCNVNCNGQVTLIGVCYRPPDSSTESDNGLFELLDKVSRSRAVIMGDFNYPDLDWSNDDKTDVSHPFVDCLGRNFLYQHVTEPTRGKNYLDLVLSTDNIVDEIQVCEPFETSDHQIIRFEITVATKIKVKSKQTKYNYFKVNYDQVREHAGTLEWENNDQQDVNNDSEIKVNQLWHGIKSNVIHLRDKFVKTKQGKSKKNLWCNSETAACRLAKKKAWNTYVKGGRDSTLYENYKEKLNKSVAANRRAKYTFENKLAENIKTDSKSFYAYVNSKKTSTNKIGPIVDSLGNAVKDPTATSNLLNDYFSSVFVTEDKTNIPEPHVFISENSDKAMPSMQIYENIVLRKLSLINTGKSHGPDEIHGKLLYEIRHTLAKPLTALFQLSIKSGFIPQDWKDADVVPLHKKGSKCKCENYRPISLTSIICKLFESIVKEAIIEHLNKNELIRDNQHGFMQGRSCLTNLLDFFEYITCELDGGNNVDIIYLDFSKAFDTVPHHRLISKLKAHGLHEEVIKWVKNWLSDRRQRVSVDGELSNWTSVSSGVPQGSVLGPILFLIYVNDLDIGLVSKLNKFADDCKLGKKIIDGADVEALRQDLNKLSDWSNTWQMKFNTDKCSILHIGRNNGEETYELNNSTLKSVNVERDLGVLLDKNMKFDEQCNLAASSANRTLGMIRRSITCKSKKIIVQLYKGLVRPKLEYCIQAWRPHLKKDIEKLEAVQHRATKMIEGLWNLSYQERLNYTGLPTLENRRDRGDMIEVYKFLNGFNKVNYTKFFDKAKYNNTRGHNFKLEKGRCRLDVRKYSFSQRVVSKWNALPAGVVAATSINNFKNRYDNYIK